MLPLAGDVAAAPGAEGGAVAKSAEGDGTGDDAAPPEGPQEGRHGDGDRANRMRDCTMIATCRGGGVRGLKVAVHASAPFCTCPSCCGRSCA
jgi:hypothetical protein